MRWQGLGPISVAYSDKNVRIRRGRNDIHSHSPHQVPDKPSAAVEGHRAQADKAILKKLEEVTTSLALVRTVL